MRYWKALAFCQEHLSQTDWNPVSLDHFSQAMGCTRRNAQLLIKRLIKEEIIEWKPGIGRGNLPVSRRLKMLEERLTRHALHLIEQGKVEDALTLVSLAKRNQFLSEYLERYQTVQSDHHVLKIPFYRGTHDLDPIGINRRTEQHIADHLYATLLKASDTEGSYQGDLAHSWTLDGNSLRITLRKGLCFHDGSPLLAQDIKAHYDRLMASDSISKQMYRFIDRVSVTGPYSLTFVSLSLPSLLPKLLAKGAMGICKQEQGRLIGSGPFILTQQTKWLTSLKANPRYHGYRPWIDGIEIWNVGDKATDFELNSDVVHGSHLKKSRHGFTQHHQWERGCVHAMLNPYRHPWMLRRQHRQWLQSILVTMSPPNDEQCEEIAQARGMLSQPSEQTTHREDKVQHWNAPLPSKPLIIMTYQLATHIAVSKQVVKTFESFGLRCELKILEYPEFNCEKTLADADILITGEVFGEDFEMSWLGWILSTNSNEACLNQKDKAWRDKQVVQIMSRPTLRGRLSGFAALEKKLITRGIYQPLYHVKQELNISDTVSAPELLANGWIDFNQVTM
ncbi:ABC transporter substrate-binding protein [Vibrio sinaloensis]|uniref:ABC transporter substrate-binding protein n=1 Tax=Photobacterium sp. (strain ATCC 43367) TaxID=379097 RepID=UPI00057E032F|nr:ABC transporter substrate-binding protein [Vibrio sinaloensis]KHT47817.1 ABC transporter substrate-binding protein [Vibrio sinaloensis]